MCSFLFVAGPKKDILYNNYTNNKKRNEQQKLATKQPTTKLDLELFRMKIIDVDIRVQKLVHMNTDGYDNLQNKKNPKNVQFFGTF